MKVIFEGRFVKLNEINEQKAQVLAMKGRKTEDFILEILIS